MYHFRMDFYLLLSVRVVDGHNTQNMQLEKLGIYFFDRDVRCGFGQIDQPISVPRKSKSLTSFCIAL